MCAHILQLLDELRHQQGVRLGRPVEYCRGSGPACPQVSCTRSVAHLNSDVTRIRLMERDNKKARDEARKEYNDTVRVSDATGSPSVHISHSTLIVPCHFHPQARPSLQGAPRPSSARSIYPSGSSHACFPSHHYRFTCSTVHLR